MQWLNLGDGNTSFFFNSIKHFHSKARISRLKRNDRIGMVELDEIKKEAEGIFKNLWRTPENQSPIDRTWVEEVVKNRVNIAQMHALIKEVTTEEVKEAMFSIKDDKAPGPDGFNSKFFKLMWHIVGDSLVRAVKSFFYSG